MALIEDLLYILEPVLRLTPCHKYTVGEDSAHDHDAEQFAGTVKEATYFST